MKRTIFIFLLITNIWLWKILLQNPLLGLVMIFTSAAVIFYLDKKSGILLFISGIIFLLIFQFVYTGRINLTSIGNEDRNVIDMRLKSYPPVYFKFGSRIIWIPLAHWVEERKESLAFYRIEKNISEVIDPNLYFFANHPRERAGIKEIEKFSYIIIPFFIAGLLLIFRSYKALLLFGLSLPLLLISIIGNNNPLGPFSLFPFVIASIYLGLNFCYMKILKIYKKKTTYIVYAFVIIYLLVLLQTISYEIS